MTWLALPAIALVWYLVQFKLPVPASPCDHHDCRQGRKCLLRGYK